MWAKLKTPISSLICPMVLVFSILSTVTILRNLNLEDGSNSTTYSSLSKNQSFLQLVFSIRGHLRKSPLAERHTLDSFLVWVPEPGGDMPGRRSLAPWLSFSETSSLALLWYCRPGRTNTASHWLKTFSSQPISATHTFKNSSVTPERSALLQCLAVLSDLFSLRGLSAFLDGGHVFPFSFSPTVLFPFRRHDEQYSRRHVLHPKESDCLFSSI